MSIWACVATGVVMYVVFVLGNHFLYWCTEVDDPILNPLGSSPWNWRLLSPLIWQYQRWAEKQEKQRHADSLAALRATPNSLSFQSHILACTLTLNQVRTAFSSLAAASTVSYWSNAREPLSVRKQIDAFIGYKTLKVLAHDGKLQFCGIRGQYYGVDATAECHNDTYILSSARTSDLVPSNHESPVQGCTCGLYALKEPADNWEYGAFRATVELFGTVIVGEKGYRAGRQRILKIEARRECVVCHKVAAGFSTGADGQVVAVCEQHGVLSCASPSELTGKLGTEVRWAA